MRPGERREVGPEEVAEASREREENERREVADDVRPGISHVLAHARGARRAAVFYNHEWLGVLPENCLLKVLTG